MAKPYRPFSTSAGSNAKREELFDAETIARMRAELIGIGGGNAHGHDGSGPGPTASRAKARPAKARPTSTRPNILLADEIYLRVSAGRQRVRQGDSINEMTVQEAVTLQQALTALKGNPRAQADFLRSSAKAQERQAAALAEQHAIWRQIRDNDRAKIEEAKAAGRPEPQELPHPDDVVIEAGRPVRFTGPVDEVELKKFEETRRFLDQMILWEELDLRTRKGTARPPGGALLLAIALNAQLPARMRLSDLEMTFRMDKANRLSKRALLKTLHAGWRDLGRPLKRGTLPPPLEKTQRFLKAGFDLIAAFQSGELDAARIGRGKTDEHEWELLATIGFRGGQR